MLVDNGTRVEHETGAVRENKQGKGRCDLLPACALIRLSKHYEAGSYKYGDRNWEQGLPTSDLMEYIRCHVDGGKETTPTGYS